MTKQADLGLDLTTRKTRKRAFLDEMERVVPWAALVELIAPHAPVAKTGRPPFAHETLLRLDPAVTVPQPGEQVWPRIMGPHTCLYVNEELVAA